MQLFGLPLLCLLVATPLASASVARNTAGSARNGRSAAASKWGPVDLGLGSVGDLPTPSWSNQDQTSSDMISVPGEDAIEDEMVALQRPTPVRPQPQFLSPKQPIALLNAQSQGLPAGATLDSYTGAVIAPMRSPTAPQVPAQTKVLEEYDETEEEGDNDDDYRTTKMVETKTAEELERQQRGDVEHVKPVEHKRPKIVVRKLKVALATQQVTKTAAKAVEAVEQAPGNDKMMGQCMAFAGWVKSQGSTGPDLVRIWKGTCMPAVMAGDAPPAYGNMCNALGTAVQKFAVRPWAPADMCQAVLQVFKESGVGGSPLR